MEPNDDARCWPNVTDDPGTCVLDINGTIVYSKPYVDAKYIAIALTVITGYMIVAMTAYELRMKKTKRAPVNHMLYISVAFQCLYCSRLLLDLTHTFTTAKACVAYKYYGALSYAVSISLIYTILWVRQRKFYSDPLLASTIGRGIKITSSVLIIAIYLTATIVPFFITKSLCAINTEVGCVFAWNRQTIRDTTPAIIMSLLVCFFCQLMLFALITRPLLSVERSSSERRQPHVIVVRPDIRSMLIRLAICTSVCVSTSVVMHVIVFLDALGYLCLFWPNVMCLDLVFSNCAVVCTFANWRHRACPFVKAKIYYEGENYQSSFTRHSEVPKIQI